MTTCKDKSMGAPRFNRFIMSFQFTLRELSRIFKSYSHYFFVSGDTYVHSSASTAIVRVVALHVCFTSMYAGRRSTRLVYSKRRRVPPKLVEANVGLSSGLLFFSSLTSITSTFESHETQKGSSPRTTSFCEDPRQCLCWLDLFGLCIIEWEAALV